MNRKNINIGLFGFGCVGYGLHEVLQKTPGLKANIKRICVKDKNKVRPLSVNHFTYDKNDLLNDESINTIVELIDDADEAFKIVKAALQKGKAVVTANKKMIAEHFEELIQLQRTYNVPLLYEASCCASIPIIRNLEEYYDNDLLESVEGVVNGSTNYILTKIIQDNLSFEQALKFAQEKGYAEANPLLDTGGYDAKYKLQILIAHAFGVITHPDEIFNLGIQHLSNLDFIYAKEKNLKIKLVAYAEKLPNGKVVSWAMPKFIKSADKLYSVDDVFNGIKTKTYFSDVQFFEGKGAGAYPTASAVLSDISALSYDYRYEYKKLNQKDTLAKDDDILLHVFLRHDLAYASEFKKYFQTLNETYLNHEQGFIIGTITLKNLKIVAGRLNAESSIILIDRIKNNNTLLPITQTEYEFST